MLSIETNERKTSLSTRKEVCKYIFFDLPDRNTYTFYLVPLWRHLLALPALESHPNRAIYCDSPSSMAWQTPVGWTWLRSFGNCWVKVAESSSSSASVERQKSRRWETRKEESISLNFPQSTGAMRSIVTRFLFQFPNRNANKLSSPVFSILPLLFFLFFFLLYCITQVCFSRQFRIYKSKSLEAVAAW